MDLEYFIISLHSCRTLLHNTIPVILIIKVYYILQINLLCRPQKTNLSVKLDLTINHTCQYNREQYISILSL